MAETESANRLRETAELLGQAHVIVQWLLDEIGHLKEGGRVQPHRLKMAQHWLAKMGRREEAQQRLLQEEMSELAARQR